MRHEGLERYRLNSIVGYEDGAEGSDSEASQTQIGSGIATPMSSLDPDDPKSAVVQTKAEKQEARQEEEEQKLPRLESLVVFAL